jgi:nucleoside-diphosphate-sugar epimerase
MSYKQALITGGAGLIGSHIADQLVADGCERIVVLDTLTRGRQQNLEHALASGKVRIVEADIRNADIVRKVMEGMGIVFHEAAIRITHCAEDPRLAHDVLATGTFNILEAAVAAKVKRVVSASSASIYSQAEDFPVPGGAGRENPPLTRGGERRVGGERRLPTRPFYVAYARMLDQGIATRRVVKCSHREPIYDGIAPD